MVRGGHDGGVRHLAGMLAARGLDVEGFCDAFLAPPLYGDDHAKGDGTLYTVVYRPRESGATYLWPGERVSQTIDAFEERDLRVSFG